MYIMHVNLAKRIYVLYNASITIFSEVYKSRSINRSLVFTVPSPEVMFNHHGEEEKFVNKNG
ncbi:MAG: hypothetical protein Q4C14_05905, partial [Bacillota bacterium]|nr:hypothetical protein [Bacillota bacterium]